MNSNEIEIRLNLSIPRAKADAARAMPALMLASAMGNTQATSMASQIVGQAITDALQPSVDALYRIAAHRDGSTS